MRIPGRLHVTWEGDDTLRIDTDAGTQTRRLEFAPGPPAGERSWQGRSVAQWEGLVRGSGPPVFLPIGLNAREGTQGRSLEVVTTNLRPGYIRRNGVPYGASATVREYFDVTTNPDGSAWLLVTTILEDPEHLTEPFVTSSDFRKEADGSRWNPTPCRAR